MSNPFHPVPAPRPSLPSRRSARGQGMTEYIVVVALVAVAAIGVYNLFGSTLRSQMAGVALGLAGKGSDAESASKRAADAAKAAGTAASAKTTLENFGKDAGRTAGN